MTDTETNPPSVLEVAQVSKAWPFEEARKIVKRYPGGKRDAAGNLAPVLFETGYGPSGLPHIGTFQEVLRTTLVRRAYEVLTGGHPTRLVAFSDDMDGLRKVPDNVPNKGLLAAYIGHPLSRTTTTRCYARFWTASASTTNSSRPAIATTPAVSTMR